MDRARVRANKPMKAIAAFALFLVAVLGPVRVAHADVTLPGTVTGVVKTAADVGIPDVTVEIWGETSSTGMPNFLQRAVTKADGQFVITDVIQGTYTLRVNASSDPVLEYSEAYPWNDWPEDSRQQVIGGATKDAGTITLTHNGVVSGRAIRGATPVADSVVFAEIQSGADSYYREVRTGPDGRFTIEGAPPGDWSLVYKGSGSDVPLDAVPTNSWGGDSDALSQSAPVAFSLAPGETRALPDLPFRPGQSLSMDTLETYAGVDYRVSGMSVTATSSEGLVYYFGTGEEGHSNVYLPPGTYTLEISDSGTGGGFDEWGNPLPAPSYESRSLPEIVATSGGTPLVYHEVLTPRTGTRAITGTLTEAGTGTSKQSWVTATLVDPSEWTNPYRVRVLSNDGHYLFRVPVTTGFSGNTVKLDWVDVGPPYVHLPQTHTFGAGSSTVTYNVTLTRGGSISGTVRDEVGTPVPGVVVNAVHRAYSADWGKVVWTGADASGADIWWARTDSNGDYTIAGLPAGSDWKVNYRNYFDYGMPLPEKYETYYFRTYKGYPLVDPWDAAITAVHTPVAVSLGAEHSGIDETITPGGYVGLHADGPDEPTGAVWCDVWYQVGSTWIEVDSGYSTGGTFEKLWKVLPTGSYRLDYADYFGRGSGSWSFELAPGETKYTSVVVPTPLDLMAGDAPVSGSFAGLIAGGLESGGTGGLHLNVQPIMTMPPLAPVPPSTVLTYTASMFDFESAGASVDGVWTLTLPYDPSIPDGVVGNVRVWHVKGDGAGELLTPLSWDTAAHTVQVQTSSLSPFQVVYAKKRVSLGRPSTSGTLKNNRTFTAYGSLSPKHTSGAHSVKVKVYKYSSRRHKWLLYKTFTAKNYAYHSSTRYKASVRLARGTYWFYAYAASDAWHLATTSSYRTVKIR